jgi:hypothetical protein
MLGLNAGYAWAEQQGIRARRVYRRKDAGVAAGRGRNKGRKLSTVAWSFWRAISCSLCQIATAQGRVRRDDMRATKQSAGGQKCSVCV